MKEGEEGIGLQLNSGIGWEFVPLNHLHLAISTTDESGAEADAQLESDVNKSHKHSE